MADARARARIVAPARWAAREVLAQFADLAGRHGVDVEIDPQATEQWHQLAGSDELRADTLRSALADEGVDIIFCARGGYGAARTLPHLSDCAVSCPKVLVGYSDITALQMGGGFAGVHHIHGAMPNEIIREGGPERLAATVEMARNLVTGAGLAGQSYSLEAVAEGEARGHMAIGNLSVITTLLGTPYEPQWDRVILTIEDCTEYLYALDRKFVQISQSRLGPAVAGIVLGDFTDLEDNEVPWGETVAQMARRHFPGIPVAGGLPIGHGDRNAPMLQGRMAALEVKKGSAALTLETVGAGA